MTKTAKPNKITIDDLAGMVQRGFAEMNERFTEIDQRFAGINAKIEETAAESRQRDEHLQKQIDSVAGDVSHIKKVVKRLPSQKDFVSLKKRVYVLEQQAKR